MEGMRCEWGGGGGRCEWGRGGQMRVGWGGGETSRVHSRPSSAVEPLYEWHTAFFVMPRYIPASGIQIRSGWEP